MHDDAIIDDHLAHLRYRGLRDSTIYQRHRVIRRLTRFTGTRLLAHRHAEIEARLRVLPAAESRACELSHLRGVFRWAVEVGHLDVDPTARLHRPRLYRRLPRPIAEADLFLALDLAPDRIRPWILLAGWAGLRSAEISRLRHEDLQLDWRHPAVVVRESKNGRDGVVPLSPWLVDQLGSCHLPTSGWLSPRHDGQPGATQPWTVSRLSAAYMRSIGVDATLHMLRHRFGTMAHRATHDLRITQELLRHETPVSTAIYTKVDRIDLVDAVAALPVP